ncbi:Bacitracin export permease protein BceB [compost metagenome]
MDQTKGSVKGAASIKTASILLVAIVSIFIFYANTIFIKRRSKEIGLFQLIGMLWDCLYAQTKTAESPIRCYRRLRYFH